MKRRRQAESTERDWQAIRRRLKRAAESLGEEEPPSPEAVRAVLEERGRALARRPQEEAGETVEVVLFDLGGERYALETRHVRAVVRYAEPTPVPGAPPFLASLVNLRGEVLAVMDLRPLLGLRADAPGERVLVVGGERSEFGILAEAADEVARLPAVDFLPPPAGGGKDHAFVRGVTRDALILLSGEALLEDPRFFIDQSQEAQQPPTA